MVFVLTIPFSIAPGSFVIDATILPLGFFLSGYSGAFVAEAAGRPSAAATSCRPRK
jgi:hypothetical protein